MADNDIFDFRQLPKIMAGFFALVAGIAAITALIDYANPTFSLDVNPSTLAINQNENKTINIYVDNEYLKPYKYLVNLSANIEPPGSDIQYNFTPSDCQVPSNVTMELTVGPNIAKGTYVISVIGKGGENTIRSKIVSAKVQIKADEKQKHIINISCVDKIILNARDPPRGYNITDKNKALDLIRGEIDNNNPMLVSSTKKPYLIVGYDYGMDNKILIGFQRANERIEWYDYDEVFSNIKNKVLYVFYETKDCIDPISGSDRGKIVPMCLSLVLDRSGSMEEKKGNKMKIQSVKEAAIDVINNMMSQDNIAVVSFSETASLDADFGDPSELVKSKINNINPDGDTSFGAGLNASLQQFDALVDSKSMHAILFMSDGQNNTPPGPEEDIAKCRERGIRIFTIGFASDESSADEQLLRYMSNETNGLYCFENDIVDLGNSFIEQQSIASSWIPVNKSEGFINKGEVQVAQSEKIGLYEYLRVLLNWPGSDLDLILVDPDGKEINSSMPGIYYSGNETKPEYIIIKRPKSGKWTAKVYGKILNHPEKYMVLFSQYEPIKTEKTYENITWIRYLGQSGYEDGRSIKKTNDGGYIIAGTTDSHGSGNEDIWLIKVNSNGIEEWNRTFGGKSDDMGMSVIETEDSGYILGGWTESYGNGSRDGWLIKTDSKGWEEWTKTFGGLSHDQATSVQQTKDGGYLICGLTDSYGAGMQDIWLIKTDSNGDEKWNRTFGGRYSDFSRSVVEMSDGGYLIGGSREFNMNDFDIWIINLDINGKERWNKTLSKPGNNFIESIIGSNDGGYMVIGGTDQFMETSIYKTKSIFLIKFSSSFMEEWTLHPSPQNESWGNSICQTSDGGYILTGYTTADKKQDKDVFLIKTDSMGNIIWKKNSFPCYGDDWAWSVQSTADGGFVIVGGTKSNKFKYQDVILIKTDENGNAP